MKKYFVLFILIFSLISVSCSNKEAVKKTDSKNIASVEINKQDNTSDIPYKLHGIPVLMYHSIGVEKNNPIKMPKEQFETEMKYLKDNGYTTLSLKELYDYFENKVPVPDKSVVITLDDGYEDNYTEAFPILKRYGLKATIFVITSNVDKNSAFITSSQIKEMDSAGIEIESHTVTHRDLDKLTYKEQYAELKDSKSFLEGLLGKNIDYMAYPTGKYNDNTIKAVKAVGYKMALSTNGRWADKTDGIFTLDRVYISTFHSMTIFKERLTNPNYKIN